MLPKTRPMACTGAPRNECMGGWLGGKPTDTGWSAMLLSRTGLGSCMSRPSTPRPVGSGPDRTPLFGRDAGGHELDEAAAVPDHSKRSIAGIGDLGGQIDDSL